MIKPGQHKELAEAIKVKMRGRTAKAVAADIGIGTKALLKLTSLKGNTSPITQHLARQWVNKK